MTDVLIVDDERPVVELLREVLTEEGYTVAAAPDGQAALDLIDSGLQPSLVLADLMMPRVTGVELAAALRARHGRQAPPVALMSANHRWLGDVEGVVAKLAKPFALEALVTVLETHCNVGPHTSGRV